MTAIALAAMAGPAAGQSDSLLVRPSPAIVIDGTVDPEEWRSATWFGSETVQLAIGEADGHLQVAIRSGPIFVANLCVASGDTVDVFHASAALGRVRYVREGTDWRLTGPFEWRMRATELDAATVRERETHRRSQGWIGSTARMGTPGETELQISSAFFPRGARIALGLLLAERGGIVGGWPLEEGADGCTLRATIAGPPPERAQFQIDKWPRVVRLSVAGQQ